MRPRDIEGWLWFIIAGGILALLACGCAGVRPGGATAAPSPTVSVEPSIVAQGAVLQRLDTIQNTLTDVRSFNASAQTELMGRVERIENLTQSVQTVMHDIGPEQAEIEKARMTSYFKIAGVVIGIFIGVLLIALAAPSVGGALVPMFYLAGISITALPIIAVLVLTFIFKL